MYKVFLTGGIASGKSTVAGELERLGARRIDLDQVSREVTMPGTAVLRDLAGAFGSDIVDPSTGELRRHLLAERAFASAEDTRRLERIEIPAIKDELVRQLGEGDDDSAPLVVVEVQLLDRAEELIPLVDEVLCVMCPLALRRQRAVSRGMDASDFDRRAAGQPTDDYLRSRANTVFDNSSDESHLVEQVRRWWDERVERAWRQI